MKRRSYKVVAFNKPPEAVKRWYGMRGGSFLRFELVNAATRSWECVEQPTFSDDVLLSDEHKAELEVEFLLENLMTKGDRFVVRWVEMEQ